MDKEISFAQAHTLVRVEATIREKVTCTFREGEAVFLFQEEGRKSVSVYHADSFIRELTELKASAEIARRREGIA